MAAVALGHWLVAEPLSTPRGLTVRDVLAELPTAAHLTWVFQVIPLFVVAGFAVGVPSWHRHRARDGTAAAWVARRTWRLLWPTLPVVAFWTLVTQVGDHVLGLDDSLLAATRGLGLVLWFLAVYVLLVALLPVLDRLADRVGTLRLMIGLAAAALVVDVVAMHLGYTSSTEPSWVWINYLLWWTPVALAGRWWSRSGQGRTRRVGALVAAVALGMLVLVTSLGWYPVAMVGVTGQVRSNTLPPTLALALLAAVQVGVLYALAEPLRRWLRRPRRYVPVVVIGSRAMTVYLWHLIGPVVATVALVLPDRWATPPVGAPGWWVARLAWVLVCLVVTVPVVGLLGRLERPPARLTVTGSPVRTAAAVVLCLVGWAAVAVTGLHVPGWPAGLPWLQLVALVGATAALVGGRADAVAGTDRRMPRRGHGSLRSSPHNCRGRRPPWALGGRASPPSGSRP